MDNNAPAGAGAGAGENDSEVSGDGQQQRLQVAVDSSPGRDRVAVSGCERTRRISTVAQRMDATRCGNAGKGMRRLPGTVPG